MDGGTVSEIISLIEERDVAITRARGSLRAGELVVMPTDTVYGIGADAFNPEATRRIFEVKKRPRSLPLPILVSRPRQAWALSADVPPQAIELAAAFWPGALTLILPETELAWEIGDTRGGVAVRIPLHDDLLALLEAVGPMAVTSANITGEPTPRTVGEIAERFGDAVGVYLDGGESPSETGSTIVDLAKGKPLLVREGPIPSAEIERVLGDEVSRA